MYTSDLIPSFTGYNIIPIILSLCFFFFFLGKFGASPKQATTWKKLKAVYNNVTSIIFTAIIPWLLVNNYNIIYMYMRQARHGMAMRPAAASSR